MRRLLFVIPLVLVLVLAACGGDDGDSTAATSSPPETAEEQPAGDDEGDDDADAPDDDAASVDAEELYADAVEALDTIESGKLDAEARALLEVGGEQEITVREQVTFAEGGGFTLPHAEVVIDVEQSGSASQHVEAVHTGDDFFVLNDGAEEFEALGASVARQIQNAYRREQRELGTGRLPLLALTPGDWALSPEVDGEETIDGEDVVRIVAEVDVPTFLTDLEEAEAAETGMGLTLSDNARELFEPDADIQQAELVALVGADDGLLRQLTATVNGNVTGGSVTVDFAVELFELNEPQEITDPTAA